ncbi:MAG: hypothetical protein ACK4S4_07295 [Pyrinomonadaceae bacterium]
MRIVIAGVVAGLLMFVWSFISHTVLPLGETGVRMLPAEPAIVGTLKQNVPESGLYFYPGLDMAHGDVSPEEQAAWAERYKAGPRGILVYRTDGDEPMGAKMLLTELASNILACIVAAWVIASIGGSFVTRAIAAGMFGVIGWLSIDVSYWNWYGFPTSYAIAQGIDQFVGWLVSGAAIALLVKPRLQ